jgi:hypothetical protein
MEMQRPGEVSSIEIGKKAQIKLLRERLPDMLLKFPENFSAHGMPILRRITSLPD